MGSDARPDGCDTERPHTPHPSSRRHTAFLQKRRKAREKAQGPIQQQLRERSCSLEDEVGSVRGRLPCTTASLQKFSCVYQPCWHLGAPPARPAPALALLPAQVRLPQARPQPAQLQAARHPARPSARTPLLKAGQRHRVWGRGTRAPSSAAEKWVRLRPQPLLERNLATRKTHVVFKRQTAFWKGSHSRASRGSWR